MIVVVEVVVEIIWQNFKSKSLAITHLLGQRLPPFYPHPYPLHTVHFPPCLTHASSRSSFISVKVALGKDKNGMRLSLRPSSKRFIS